MEPLVPSRHWLFTFRVLLLHIENVVAVYHPPRVHYHNCSVNRQGYRTRFIIDILIMSDVGSNSIAVIVLTKQFEMEIAFCNLNGEICCSFMLVRLYSYEHEILMIYHIDLFIKQKCSCGPVVMM